MLNVDGCNTLLWMFVLVIGVVAIVLFLFGNCLFWILRLLKIYDGKGVWLLSNIIGAVLLLLVIVPPILDITFSTYYSIDNIASIKLESSNFSRYDKNANHTLLITDNDGNVHSCYDYLIDTDGLLKDNPPQRVICAKYSRLLLGYSFE